MAVTISAISPTVNPTAPVTNQPFTVLITVTNTGTTAVTVTDVQLELIPTSQVAYEKNQVSIGVVNLTGPNSPLAQSISNSQSLSILVPCVIQSSSQISTTNQPLNTGTGTYSTAGAVYTSDGTVTSIGATTISVPYAVTFSSAQS